MYCNVQRECSSYYQTYEAIYMFNFHYFKMIFFCSAEWGWGSIDSPPPPKKIGGNQMSLNPVYAVFFFGWKGGR